MAHSESSPSSPGYSNSATAGCKQHSSAPADSDSALESGLQSTSSGQEPSPPRNSSITPAMSSLTLGRDGSDFEEIGIGMDATTSVSNGGGPKNASNNNSNNNRAAVDVDHRPWWDRVTNINPFHHMSISTSEPASDSLSSPAAGVAHAHYRSSSGGGAAETTSTAVYTSLDTHTATSPNNHKNNGKVGEAEIMSERMHTSPTRSDPHANARSLLPQLQQQIRKSGRGMEQSSLSSSGTGESKAEDLLQQDCSFFYQGMELPPARGASEARPPNRRLQRLRALVRPSQQSPQHQYQQQSQLFEYRDSVDVFAPPVLANYRARYQQLNQILRTDSDEDLAATAAMHNTHHHHDLELMTDTDDGDGISLTHNSNKNNSNSSPHRNARMAQQTVENSSLFYSLHGRMLMRLPRDQVRLVMDNDLEAGILSVEQWRDSKDDDWQPEQHVDTISAAALPYQDRPQLRYVLTVHDDLYRRIVAEMSEGLTKPYWGLSGCCNENERVDIRVAVAVMAVIMLVLLINTFIWPVE
jgi:hypothetical protein